MTEVGKILLQWKIDISHLNVKLLPNLTREQLWPGFTHRWPCGKNRLHHWTPEYMFVSSSAHGLCHLGWESPHLGVASLSCRWSVMHGEMWAIPRCDLFPLSHKVRGTVVKTFVANVLYEGCNVTQSEGHSAKSQESWLISYGTT